MYNRYIPQPDGTYRRNRMQDAQRSTPPPSQQPPCNFAAENTATCPGETIQPPNIPPCQDRNNTPPRKRQSAPPSNVGKFLRQLLPGDFDTEDLLVVILLLLMAGDCEEDRNNALLTMALYLFL